MMLAACGGGNAGNAANEGAGNTGPADQVTDGTDDGRPERTVEISVAMVTDVGGVNDNSFNQSAWEGLQQFAEEHGGKVDYLQSQNDADYVPNLNQFVKSGRDLTWGIGYMMSDAIRQVANQNPESKLGIVDDVVDAPNVVSVTFKENDGGFLVGVVAGMMTKTNKIGFVGGSEIPVITRFEAGFKAGIEAANPDAQLIVNYTGAFDAPDQGKAAASTIYNSGADIIFHAAGSTGDGVFGQAKELRNAGRDVWVIGVDKDQAQTFGNDITLTSMIKRVDVAVRTISEEVMRDEFKGGEVVTLGLKENGVGLPEHNPNLPQEVLDKVEEFKQRIIDGELTVPENP
ncbi:BMP family ABC transporter substrate-binding protein [Xylanibacillus composti]|nr:BMP family ABC transporter substrate-binding protein [Xylanibacillus composti]